MGKSQYKKIYKTNKKLLKKILVGVILILLICILYKPVTNWLKYSYLNTWTWHEIEKYDFSVKLPRAYKDLEAPNNDKTGIISSVFKTETEIEVNEEYVSKKPEVVYNGGNILNGISLNVQVLETSKTTKTLDEIAESHHVLVSIFYEDDYTIGELKNEYLKILGTDAIKATIDISNEKVGEKTMITYLVPMEDKEITITFFGKKSVIESQKEEIEKIVGQIK